MIGLFKQIFYSLGSRIDSLSHEWAAQRIWNSLEIGEDVLKSVKSRLKEQFRTDEDNFVPDLYAHKTIRRIQEMTAALNRNNVTRTAAYGRMFFKFPELHWAFLAHMVSRNGGWHMTDLKGDLLSHLLDGNETLHFFHSLERANALIFQDAFPQLLLYEESVRQQKNLFHLLPAFHVSRFMRPIWEDFWQTKNSQLLTIGLIINEQNYIQKRVVEHPVFQRHVYETMEFKAQSLLQLTQIVFPFCSRGRKESSKPQIRLAGLIMEDFTDLNERIGVGKSLYAILFGIKEVREGALQFAKEVPHTGSRADYWPDFFSKSDREKNGPPFYSPELENAWQDQPFEPPERFDWCTDLSALKYFRPVQVPRRFDMTDDHCSGLNRVKLAVLATDQLNPWREK